MADCAVRIFGAENILSFVVHRDQDNPHAHMLVSPISGGKYLGSKLHMREPLERLKAEFAKSAETIGFQPVPDKKIRRQKLKDMVAKIVAYLEHANDPLLFHPQWPVILQMIAKDPLPLFQRLNLETVHLPRTMSQDRLVANPESSSTTGDSKIALSDHQNLPSVGFRKAGMANEGSHPDRSDCKEAQLIRVQDSELLAENFDFETGEFFLPSDPPRLGKSEAEKWVSSALYELNSNHHRN